MRGIEDMRFTAEANGDGRFVGRVAEFPNLHSRPYRSRLDAIDEIVRLTSQRLREIHESMGRASS